MAGYSGTPLGKKLGIRPGTTLHVVNAPCDYSALVAPLPEGTVIALTGTQDLDFVHIFATSRSDLTASLNDFRRKIKQNGVIWVSWPKRASGVPSEIDESTIREVRFGSGWLTSRFAPLTRSGRV